MPPPQQQLPSDHANPRPRYHPPSRHRETSSVPVSATKRPPPPPSAPSAAAAKKMARPSSAPDLTAAARPRPRPPSTPAKTGGGGAAPHAAKTGRPASSSSASSSSASSSFMAPRGAQTVHPARRLTPGTPVYVRTTFRPRNVGIRCRILLWLRARVVSSPDAYHCKVKYAADLSELFAGKIVSKPADQVRVAATAPAAKLKPAKPEMRTREAAHELDLPRRR